VAWDAWVKALVAHFMDRVQEWEVWNEPDGGHGITEEGFAEFHLRTAAISRAEQPRARIFALALASPGNLTTRWSASPISSSPRLVKKSWPCSANHPMKGPHDNFIS
jgi:hypothetical protein